MQNSGVTRRGNVELRLAYRAWRILRDAASRLLRMRLSREAGSPHGEERGNAARLRTMLRIAGRTMCRADAR